MLTTLVCVLFVATPMSTEGVLVCTTLVCVLFVATPMYTISVYYFSICTVCGTLLVSTINSVHSPGSVTSPPHPYYCRLIIVWGALLVPAIIVYTNHTVSVLCLWPLLRIGSTIPGVYTTISVIYTTRSSTLLQGCG